MVHENSTKSYEEHKAKGKSVAYRKKIMDALALAEPLTDRQLMNLLHVTDPNLVRPEVTRLKQAGAIVECGKVKCPETGKTVRTVKIRESRRE